MAQQFLNFQADEHVVSKGLEDHPRERNALRDKPGTVSKNNLFANPGVLLCNINTVQVYVQ